MNARWIALTGVGIGAATILLGGWCWRVRSYWSPAAAIAQYSRFEADREQQLTDPLVLCGPDVVPLVISGLENRSLEGRPWLAAFLGDGGYHEGASILEQLALDASEYPHTRSYALRSLALLQRPRAESIAAGLVGDPQLRGAAEDVLRRDDSMTYRRSYLEALLDLGD